MTFNTDITEFVEVTPDELHLVPAGANGFEPLLAKSAVEDEVEIVEKACGDPECGVCESVAKGKLKAADRKKLPKGSFAVPEKAPGSGSYPIPDESHARDALARASGKDVEGRVRSAVRRKFPDIQQAEKAADDTAAEKSPGVPEGSTATPQVTATVHQFAESGLRGPMIDGTKEPEAVDTPGGETPAVGGSNTQVIPVESKVATKDALAEAQACLEQEDARGAEKGDGWIAADNETVEKIGRRLSTKTETALRAARDHLAHVLGEDSTTQAGHAGNTSEEDQIMTTLTKEELDAVVAKAAADAVKEDRKARAAKKQAKADKRAKKNANNGGDIDRAALEAGVHGTHAADDIAGAGGDVKPEYVTKEQFEQLTKQLNAFAARPRSGGPNLTGTIPAGLLAAAEGRQGEGVVKSAEDENISTLQKQLVTALDGKDSQRATELSYRLTKAQLMQMHEQGDERTVKLFG